jgi:hypothetical protein
MYLDTNTRRKFDKEATKDFLLKDQVLLEINWTEYVTNNEKR